MPENNQDNIEDMSTQKPDPHTPQEGADPLFEAILAKQKALMAEGLDVTEAAVDAAVDVLSFGREPPPW